MTDAAEVVPPAPTPGLAEASTRPGAAGFPAPGDEASIAALRELAEAYGIAAGYRSFFGSWVDVPAQTLTALLDAMGVRVRSTAQLEAALAARRDAPWRQLLPPSLVVREGTGELVVHAAVSSHVEATLVLEDGTRRRLAVPDAPNLSDAQRVVDGVATRRLHLRLPDDLPSGWHEIHATEMCEQPDSPSRTAVCILAVTPARLPPPPPSRPQHAGRAWGVMAQLYSVRSRRSWGIGDLADLADLARLVGHRGADFVLINPIHAGGVTAPLEPSPYRPASRRFLSPLMIRPEDIAEAAQVSAEQRDELQRLHDRVAADNTNPGRIDRDTAWAVKKTALEIVYAAPRSTSRATAFRAFVQREGRPLDDFALWCALHERAVPAASGDPTDTPPLHSPTVTRLRPLLADRVMFYSWLQWIADEQLAATQAAAVDAGMRMGIMQDLAVGVHPQGADVWANTGLYTTAASVGAPPDMYNPQGQDWSQPPWLPDALARSGYAPLRDLLRHTLRNGAALRIDHIMGFFRLWWVPAGQTADAGAYVRYDHEAMIGVLALEAQRAGAVIIGEDLGNVEPWVRERLAERGILGTSVLWFENDENGPIPPERHREWALETVTTHDLPPAAGYLAAEHVRLRARLGLLDHPPAEEEAAARRERDTMLTRLRERGLIGPNATQEQIVTALHVYAAASPARLLAVALVDAVGEHRPQNQPGTSWQYPNWQVPLADADGRVVLADDLDADPRFGRLLRAVDVAVGQASVRSRARSARRSGSGS